MRDEPDRFLSRGRVQDGRRGGDRVVGRGGSRARRIEEELHRLVDGAAELHGAGLDLVGPLEGREVLGRGRRQAGTRLPRSVLLARSAERARGGGPGPIEASLGGGDRGGEVDEGVRRGRSGGCRRDGDVGGDDLDERRESGRRLFRERDRPEEALFDRVGDVAALQGPSSPEPGEDEGLLRPRERDVEEPLLLGPLPQLVRGRDEAEAGSADGDSGDGVAERERAPRPVVEEGPASRDLLAVAEAEAGDDDGVELEALGLVERQETDGVVVLLERPGLGDLLLEAKAEAGDRLAEGEPFRVEGARQDEEPVEVRRGLEAVDDGSVLDGGEGAARREEVEERLGERAGEPARAERGEERERLATRGPREEPFRVRRNARRPRRRRGARRRSGRRGRT